MRNSLPVIISIISIWLLLLIPFQIIGYGFMPPDDAMRHSAKIISGKEWDQILVFRNGIKMDSYPGWHAILNFVHRVTGCAQHGLLIFSVVSLFILFCLIPVFNLKFPESWLLTLFVISLAWPWWIQRLLLGRPYIFTMSILLVILFIWPRLKDKKFQYAGISILAVIAALSVWIHASWYFFALVIVSFMLAREWRVSAIIAISSIIGIFLGASLTGHPVLFLRQEVAHLFLVFGSQDAERLLVSELRPAIVDYHIIVAVLLVLGWRSLRGMKIKSRIDNPIFILASLSFILAFFSKRFWLDWGMPAFAIWLAKEFDEFLESKLGPRSWNRLGLTVILAAIVFLSITTDADSRWSMTKPMDYILSNDQQQKGWLPDPGGIIYSDDMGIFYQTFYRNPKADWRYMLGFESSFMPQEDLNILRNIQRNRWSYKCFEPWVKKMRYEDRLILRGNEDSKPKIPELEWKYIARETWSGKKPKNTP